MSLTPAAEPECARGPGSGVDLVIHARVREIARGFAVRRLLPASARRMVGPFIYFDHMGPVDYPPGGGMDVKPHPHIGLATVTYLFEGELLHQDSLGSRQPIRPGEVNWMTAGRGIVHSERTPPELREMGGTLHGLQLWVALPDGQEEAEPEFHHHPGATLPEVQVGGVRLRVLAGTAYGATSPVRVHSPLFYVDAAMPAGSTLPLPEGPPERAAYVAWGSVACGAAGPAGAGDMLVFAEGAKLELRALADTRLVLLGGAPVGKRLITWNFVSSSADRIDRATEDWKARRFPLVPGDEVEFIPFPSYP